MKLANTLRTPAQRIGLIVTISSTIVLAVTIWMITTTTQQIGPPQLSAHRCGHSVTYKQFMEIRKTRSLTSEEQATVDVEDSVLLQGASCVDATKIVFYTPMALARATLKNTAEAAVFGDISNSGADTMENALAYYATRALLIGLFLWLLYELTLARLLHWIIRGSETE